MIGPKWILLIFSALPRSLLAAMNLYSSDASVWVEVRIKIFSAGSSILEADLRKLARLSDLFGSLEAVIPRFSIYLG